MSVISNHKFHVPTMGIGYTLDTPIKIAKYGISAAVSLVQDDVIEKARKYYAKQFGKPYSEIDKKAVNFRSKRITAYLDLSQDIVDEEFNQLKSNKEDLEKCFSLLPEYSELRASFFNYINQHPSYDLSEVQDLIAQLTPGQIDVNIMSKLDRDDPKGVHLSEACSALEGFARSKVKSSIIISAGMNPRLFSFMADFDVFFPNKKGELEKQIILKVSDYRSALLQGKILAKKGLWVSEYRIESGLNCGGHAFATNGFLMGPILEEFKNNKQETIDELFEFYQVALTEKGINLEEVPEQKITAQGGIGTVGEQRFLMNHYELDSTGWGTPFLLVPEATTIDDETLDLLVNAGEDDLFVSDSSPLGVKYNNIKGNSADKLRLDRIEKGKPGSPCFKKHCALNTEFEGESLCTASRTYQKKKITELDSQKTNLTADLYQTKFDAITIKECICDGLAVSLLRKMDEMEKSNNPVVSICPGPNLAYYNRTFSLKEMVGHIYGRFNIVKLNRPNMFLKELGLYVDHFKGEINEFHEEFNKRKERELKKFKNNLLAGIQYYESIASILPKYDVDSSSVFMQSLNAYKGTVLALEV